MAGPLDQRKGDTLPPELMFAVEREARGERIVWWGTPKPWRHAKKGFALTIFAVPWTAFALFWIAGAAGFKAPDLSKGIDFDVLFPLFGVPFVLMGLGMLFAPLFALRRAKRTVYVLTDRRAISISGRRVRTYGPADIHDLERTTEADGTGDLYFASRLVRTKHGHRSVPDGFEGIFDPGGLEGQVRDLQRLGEEEQRRAAS